MRLRALRSCAGLRVWRFNSGATLGRLLHLHEVADLPQHASDDRGVVELVRPADLAEPERAEGAAVALRLADAATNLRQLQLRHSSSPPRELPAAAQSLPRPRVQAPPVPPRGTGEHPGSTCRAPSPRPRARAGGAA